MFREIFLRLVIGGSFVSLFALVSAVLRPKRFAGLFGAAPSVALATLTLTVTSRGKDYAAFEARSMMAGAVAFLVYSCCVYGLLVRHKLSALQVTLFLMPLWFAVAFGIWFVLIR